MFCYALGGLAHFDGIYDIDNIHLVIYQPRKENISEYRISKSELINWAEKVLSPTAQLAIKGKDEYNAGEHCRFCKSKATCRKRAEYNLELAKYDFEVPATLENDEMAAILTKVDKLVPPGKPVLVTANDKRPEFNSAYEDFNENQGGK